MVNATAGSFNWEYGNKFAYFVDQNSTPHEARRHPEVSEENFERETSTVLEETVANPKVDTWKPTIKDFKRKIALENQVTDQSQFKCYVGTFSSIYLILSGTRVASKRHHGSFTLQRSAPGRGPTLQSTTLSRSLGRKILDQGI